MQMSPTILEIVDEILSKTAEIKALANKEPIRDSDTNEEKDVYTFYYGEKDFDLAYDFCTSSLLKLAHLLQGVAFTGISYSNYKVKAITDAINTINTIQFKE